MWHGSLLERVAVAFTRSPGVEGWSRLNGRFGRERSAPEGCNVSERRPTTRHYKQEALMYGSIFRFNFKPGGEEEARKLMEAENDDQRLKGSGLKASYIFKLDKGGYMGVAVFESKEKYVANANDPKQDEWYRKFRALTEADPEWNDGEIISSM
jgi:hypothetical protein